MTGQATTEQLSPHVLRIAVPTPTLPPLQSTNTYIIYDDDAAIVVDCGTDDREMASAVIDQVKQLGVTQVRAYIATHYHLDHTRGIPLLKAHMPAPCFAHPLDKAQTAKEMHCSPNDVEDIGDTFTLGSVRIDVLHRPGHTHGHLHLHVQPDNLLLVGDHLAGEGTVWIGPPDGHMDDYYASLETIIQSDVALLLPGHGDVIRTPQATAKALLAHRLSREEEIVDFLRNGPSTLDEVVEQLYGKRSLGPALWVAKHTTQAHLARLINLNRVARSCKAPDFHMRYHINPMKELAP